MQDFTIITTRGGDDGNTSLLNGERRGKDDMLFELLGDLDETNSWFGVIKAESKERHPKIFPDLEHVQRNIMHVSAIVASPSRSKLPVSVKDFDVDEIIIVERNESKLLKKTEIPKEFVLPGGSSLAARTDVLRTIVRRSERRIVTLIRSRFDERLLSCQKYLNRLSDYLFILARYFEQN